MMLRDPTHLSGCHLSAAFRYLTIATIIGHFSIEKHHLPGEILHYLCISNSRNRKTSVHLDCNWQYAFRMVSMSGNAPGASPSSTIASAVLAPFCFSFGRCRCRCPPPPPPPRGGGGWRCSRRWRSSRSRSRSQRSRLRFASASSASFLPRCCFSRAAFPCPKPSQTPNKCTPQQNDKTMTE